MVGLGELARERRVCGRFGGQLVEVARRIVEQRLAHRHGARQVADLVVVAKDELVGELADLGEAPLGRARARSARCICQVVAAMPPIRLAAARPARTAAARLRATSLRSKYQVLAGRALTG